MDCLVSDALEAVWTHLLASVRYEDVLQSVSIDKAGWSAFSPNALRRTY